jgi:uncharacterized membrane protein
VTVTLGFLLKGQCLAPWSGGIQYSHLCYNDIQPLYVVRDIRGTFPYVHGGLVHGQLVGGAVEYPVLTGMFMWLTARLASSVDQYLVASALLLMPWALITAYLLARLTGRRAYLWAAAPALVLYSFHNWDLLAVAAATAGFYELSRRKPVGAAALFGIGAAFKLYPGFFLLPLVTALWLDGQRGRAAAAAGAGAGIFAVINLPFLLVSFSGWAATYRFHEQRAADYNSIWHWMAPGLSVGTLNTVTGALTAASFALALVTGAVRCPERWWLRFCCGARSTLPSTRSGCFPSSACSV